MYKIARISFFYLFIFFVVIFNPINMNYYLTETINDKIDSDINISKSLDDFDFKTFQSSSVREYVGVQNLLDLGYNGLGVTVGIIDSGVNGWYSEFEGRVIDNKTFTSTLYGYQENITSTTDIEYGGSGHGTGVGSLIIGKTLGMAPKANLVSAKLYHSSSAHGNNGVAGEETSLAVVEAIKWLVDEKNVSVINLSLGQYHNMYSEGREYWINKYSLEKNVIFVASAGNEGSYDNNYGSIGNPASSLQAVTVGTSEWSSFSGNGPRYDNALKPDVVAPGVGVQHLRADTGTITTGSGTSYSAPIVAGSVALLISALKNNNISYTSGTIKSALLSTAQSLTSNQFRQGAGLINTYAAFNKILSSSKTNSTLPDLITAFPNKLPYFPLSTHFIGQRMTYNVTLVSSGVFTGTFSITGLPPEFVSLPNQIEIMDSTILPVTIVIPENAIPGFYSGSIVINTNRNNFSLEITLSFYVRQPKLRVLLDLTHSGIINQHTTSINGLADPWSTPTLWGTYQRFLELLTSYDVSLSTSFPRELENLSFLSEYDVVLITNPATKLNGTFSDWWNDLINFPESTPPDNVNRFTFEELNSLFMYTNDFGGHLQIFTSYPYMTDIDELNKLLNVYNISYQSENIISDFELSEISNSFPISTSFIDYIGGSINDINQSNPKFEGQFYEKPLNTNYVFAHWESNTNGSVFVSGSPYMLELGLSSLGTYSENNKEFYLGLLNKIYDDTLTLIEPTETVISSSFTSSTATSQPSSLSSSTSSGSEPSLPTTSIEESTVQGFLMILVIAGLFVVRRRRFKREL